MIEGNGPGRENLNRWVKHNVYRLQHAGAVMMILGPIIPFLIVVKIIPNSYALGFLSYILIALGGFLFIVGFIWDNLIDRSG